MKESGPALANIFQRYIGLQITLLIFGITLLTLGFSTILTSRFDNVNMREDMERSAAEISNLLRMIIDKPMIVGDDQGTTVEFNFLREKLPNVAISMASFTGNITYSTLENHIRKDVKDVFSNRMNPKDQATYLSRFRSGLKGEAPEGSVLVMEGRRKYLSVQPVMNTPACHHCHGSSQPVLGAMAVLQDVEDDMQAATSRTLRAAVSSTLGGLLLVASVFFFIKRRLVSRLEVLASTSDSIVSGDYNARFDIKGHDELGHLGGNLGKMLQSLKKLGVAQSVMRGMQVPSVMCDLDGKVNFVNLPLLQLLEEQRGIKEVIGVPVNELIYGSGAANSIFERVLKNNSVCLGEEESVPGRSGRQLRLRFDANPVLDLEGNLSGAFCSITDLTAIRENEASILAQNETISNTASEASVLTGAMGRATSALAGQIEQTRRQASEQQSLADKTVSDLEEINQVMGDIARNTSQAADHAEESKQSALEGSSIAGRVAEEMETLVDSAEALKTQMEELGAKTEGVVRVMQVIQDIADQTNLLALNAAIEAARAGDAGRGFAVVADEVRKLAEKTMQATVEVGKTIAEIRESSSNSITAVEQTANAIAKGSEQVDVTAASLKNILGLAESLAAEMQAIASAVEEQSASTESVRGSIHQIKDISQEATSATEETERAVRSLVDIASKLDGIVAGMSGAEAAEAPQGAEATEAPQGAEAAEAPEAPQEAEKPEPAAKPAPAEDKKE